MDKYSLPDSQRSQPAIFHNDERHLQSWCNLDNSYCPVDNWYWNQQRIDEPSRVDCWSFDTRNRWRRRYEPMLCCYGRINARTHSVPIFVLYPTHSTNWYYDWSHRWGDFHRLRELDMGFLLQLHILCFGYACHSIRN